ncbi:PAS domain-containing sensor histidine kinase [Bacteroidota bacterium]
MSFNRFNITIVFICVLIAISGVALVEVWTNSDYRIAKLTVSIIWMALVFGLINYVNKTNRSLKRFLDSLRYSDYVAETDSAKSFKELNLSFNEILRYVRLAELEKESTDQYLRQILDEMPTGIIAANENGYVEIINRAGLNILEIISLSKLSELDKLENGLEHELNKLSTSKKKVISLQTKSGLKSILFRTEEILINQRKIQIISFENIRTELDDEEEKTWKKIFRVLTHEIMNSIGPIRSLTASVLKIFFDNNSTKNINQLKNDDIQFAVTGLKSIDNRNQGLSKFVSDFKKLMRIPEPHLNKIDINKFIDETLPLLQEICTNKKIKISYNQVLNPCIISIDKEQITQVLINLVKNSSEAIQVNTGDIIINASDSEDNLCLTISDNGEGIPKDVMSEIFIPFFTTKKDGNGIGLSISRQIIRNHGGDLKISSEPKKGTICELSFPIVK